MTRTHVTYLLMALLLGWLGIDKSVSKPLNPYNSPSAIALGSGEQGAGAFCSALPTAK